MALAASQARLFCSRTFLPINPIIHSSKSPKTHLSSFSVKPLVPSKSLKTTKCKINFKLSKITCYATQRKPTAAAEEEEDLDGNLRRVLQVLLWVAEGIYILWLFLLPFAPVSISICVAICTYIYIYIYITIFGPSC